MVDVGIDGHQDRQILCRNERGGYILKESEELRKDDAIIAKPWPETKNKRR
jgi:hypothetical protein